MGSNKAKKEQTINKLMSSLKKKYTQAIENKYVLHVLIHNIFVSLNIYKTSY